MNVAITVVLVATMGLVAGAGCGAEDIDPADLNVSIEGYRDWDAIELIGKVPAHGDTIRLLYRNDAALAYTGGGEYPLGSAMVKEIYTIVDGDQRGTLSYSAVMRRLTADSEDEGADIPGDLPIEDGWLFTDLRGTSETYKTLCWNGCHVAAPYQGAFFDHGL